MDALKIDSRIRGKIGRANNVKNFFTNKAEKFGAGIGAGLGAGTGAVIGSALARRKINKLLNK